MLPSVFLTLLLAPLALGLPSFLSPRQAPKKPKPCTPLSPLPTEAETKVRFDKFAYEFLTTKNITAAFEFINQGYIVCSLHHISLPLILISMPPQPICI